MALDSNRATYRINSTEIGKDQVIGELGRIADEYTNGDMVNYASQTMLTDPKMIANPKYQQLVGNQMMR